MRQRLLMLCVLVLAPLVACDARDAAAPTAGTDPPVKGGPGLPAIRVIYVKQGQSVDSAIRAAQAANPSVTQPSSDTVGGTVAPVEARRKKRRT